jgi:hypothetical protein
MAHIDPAIGGAWLNYVLFMIGTSFATAHLHGVSCESDVKVLDRTVLVLEKPSSDGFIEISQPWRGEFLGAHGSISRVVLATSLALRLSKGSNVSWCFFQKSCRVVRYQRTEMNRFGRFLVSNLQRLRETPIILFGPVVGSMAAKSCMVEEA